MAFVAMILIVLATGVADLGRAIFTFIGVQDAAQEGAMYASYHPDDFDRIRERAIDSIDYPTMDPTAVAVACSADDKMVTVTVTHTVDMVTPVISQLLGDEVELSRSFTGEVLGGGCDT